MIDYGKFLTSRKKKAHEAKKKQVTVQVKEIKFRPGTDDHDYGIEWSALRNGWPTAIRCGPPSRSADAK
jgi:translation initiation factor IF-3